MGISYRKSKKLMPGLKGTIGLKGGSLRIGGKHLGVSVSTKRRVTASGGAAGVRYQKRVKGGGGSTISIIVGVIVGLLIIGIGLAVMLNH